MRFLGIDYGTKRIGLALSDEEGQFAYPHVVLMNGPQAIEQIATICRGEKVGEIVLGWSLNYRRQENPLMKKINLFKTALTAATNLPIVLEDEVLTTREADQEIGPDKFTDARAASIILRTYLAHRDLPSASIS